MLIGKICEEKEKAPEYMRDGLVLYVKKKLVHFFESRVPGVPIAIPYKGEDGVVCKTLMRLSCCGIITSDIDGYLFLCIEYNHFVPLSGLVKYISYPLLVMPMWKKLDGFLWVDRWGRVYAEILEMPDGKPIKRCIEQVISLNNGVVC